MGVLQMDLTENWNIEMAGRCFNRGLVILGIIAVLISCKTKSIVIENSEVLASEESEVSQVWKKDIKTLKIKQVEGEVSINGSIQRVKGNIALQRDSLIVISIVPALGYEVLRILCSPDSIIVINRQEKNYTRSSLDEYRTKNNIPVGFTEIQAMIACEVFYYKFDLPGRSYKRYFEDSTRVFVIESGSGDKKLTRQSVASGNAGPERILIVDYKDKLKVSLTFEDYTFSDNFAFPGKVDLILLEPRNSIELHLKYGPVIYNEPLRMQFEAPSSYLKVEI